jgi:hypothetical protein
MLLGRVRGFPGRAAQLFLTLLAHPRQQEQTRCQQVPHNHRFWIRNARTNCSYVLIVFGRYSTTPLGSITTVSLRRDEEQEHGTVAAIAVAECIPRYAKFQSKKRTFPHKFFYFSDT